VARLFPVIRSGRQALSPQHVDGLHAVEIDWRKGETVPGEQQSQSLLASTKADDKQADVTSLLRVPVNRPRREVNHCEEDA
jgi:hypothetical protein